MVGFDLKRRRLFVVLAAVGAIILLLNLSMISGTDLRSKIKNIPLPLPGNEKPSSHETSADASLPTEPSRPQDHEKGKNGEVDDKHPIRNYMQDADEAWAAYDESRSMTFKETVTNYRRRYGRHPPPGFRDWYKFARDKGVHNVDDFEQIMDDLRPFWGVEPAVIRSLAAHMSADESAGVSGLHVRNQKIWKLTNQNWRVETLSKMVEQFVKYLPDMDIAMNRLDQPRVVVPWNDMQKLLAKEEASRRTPLETLPEWTTGMSNMLKEDDPAPNITDPKWFSAPGKQYMLIAKQACPPESHARDNTSTLASAEALYKDPRGGYITNFNRSSDLCTIGPEIEDKHGFLFAPSTVIASHSLVPVFGECKVNVNSDILFPANMYYLDDERYVYSKKYDYDWDDKLDSMIWRGVTSGGTNTADNWMKMHRQRLVLITNGTVMADKDVRVMSLESQDKSTYNNYDHFHPGEFANKHTDVGFTEAFACYPNCSFYDSVWTYKPMTKLSEQFKSKYVIDVDGHSFSGRWRAFLQSKALGIKATIFREWHDSRLFAWRHFVPLDNQYDDIYSILTYFIGSGNPGDVGMAGVYIPRHDFEARKLGEQGREWAAKVLRKEDLEIYTFRLLIEYARIIDDNRDRIGYSGDGSELDKYDAGHPMTPSNGGHG